MIRLNRFFTAKAAAEDGQQIDRPPAEVSDAWQADPIPAGADGPDLASRLRRAMDGTADGSAPTVLDGNTLSAIPLGKSDDLPHISPDSFPSSTDEPAPQPVATPKAPPEPQIANPAPFDMAQLALTPSPSTPSARRAGRVRTRLLGFDPSPALTADPIEAARSAVPPSLDRFPVGWIVVTGGPGRGAFFALFNGVSQIGRGDDQVIKLDFGDVSISRSNHAAIAYDDEKSEFFLGHGGKTNLVRLNDRPLISTEPLRHQDVIRIGETTLLFVALCSSDFRWIPDDDEASDFA